ncbi:MAG: glycosyltransferase [Verrucomicrobiales bacterium]
MDKLVRKKIPVVSGAIRNYYKYLERRQLRRSDHVITITDDFNPLLVSSFGVPESKVTAIPNWAPLDSLPVETKANGWAQAHDLADKFVFLYTGTLGMKHNPALLRDLAKSMRPHPKARVVVISEGLGADWLMAEKSAAGGGLDNLMVMPYQPFESLPQVLGAGDCLIAVLEEDAGIFSVPSKVLTYLCAGKPLLLACPQVNLAARIVRENEAGLVVAPSDLRGFLDNAAKIYGDIKLSEKFGENSRNYAESTFNICDIALKFENVIKN